MSLLFKGTRKKENAMTLLKLTQILYEQLISVHEHPASSGRCSGSLSCFIVARLRTQLAAT